jgi:hypothetical protein
LVIPTGTKGWVFSPGWYYQSGLINLAMAGFDPEPLVPVRKGSKRTGTNGFWGPAAEKAEKAMGHRASVPVHSVTGTNALEY